nr:hypothetical protein GCM10025730_30650 [Promicromonospora thailandica]
MAAVAAVVAVTLTTAGLVRDHQRAELMRTSPVGVASLADPPEEVWTLPFDRAFGRSDFVDQPTVVMDGLLVLLPTVRRDYFVLPPATGAADPAPAGFDDVTAVDPASGEVAWQVPVGEDPECGPSGYDATIRTGLLTCVQGPPDAREVLAIQPDGGTSLRRAGLSDDEQLVPGPAGLVVRLRRLGDPVEPPPAPVCDPEGVCDSLLLTEGRDVRVTGEDPLTGAELWRERVAFEPREAASCFTPWTGTDGAQELDLDHVTASAGAETVAVEGCGVQATLSADGVRLDTAGERQAGRPAWVTELGSGRFAVESGSSTSFLVDGAGAVLGTVAGYPQPVEASPDAPDDLLFPSSMNGAGFDAVREDGTVLWTERYATRVLLSARDVVVADRGSKLVGLDRDTGAEVWEWEHDDPRGLGLFRTVTDGETVASVYLPQDDAARGELVAIDLATGKERWAVPVAGPVVAVDGNLVAITPNGLHGLG